MNIKPHFAMTLGLFLLIWLILIPVFVLDYLNGFNGVLIVTNSYNEWVFELTGLTLLGLYSGHLTIDVIRNRKYWRNQFR